MICSGFLKRASLRGAGIVSKVRFIKVNFFILMMSSMIFLSSSSFFLPAYLTKQLKDNNYNDAQLAFALGKNYVAALMIQETKAEIGSINWIIANQALAKTQWKSALKLAHWYQNTAELETRDTLNSRTILWYEQAIRLHSEQAVVDLALLYFKQNQMTKAQETINLLPDKLPSNNLGETTLRLRLNIAVHLGEIDRVKQLLTFEAVKLFRQNKTLSLLSDLVKYAVVKKNTLPLNFQLDDIKPSFENSSSCITSVQLFATNLKHLMHLEHLVKTFKDKQPLAEYVCLPIPRYISLKRLDCKAKSQQTITCDEARWQDVAEEVKSRHIGLMLSEGGANVHLGILYFDAQDNDKVFSHEISHLLGFIDEYPLIEGHDKCQGIQTEPFSHNMAVLKKYYRGDKQKLRAKILKNVSWANTINSNTPILQRIDEKSNKQKIWRLGTPLKYKEHIGIHFSESCQKSTPDVNSLPLYSISRNRKESNLSASYSAFKPLTRRTQLRYFAEEFPKEYISFLQANPSGYLMPSFHYNIALALYQQGEDIAGEYWLKKAVLHENDSIRKVKILRGGF